MLNTSVCICIPIEVVRLSFMELTYPNLDVGGFACHGPYEHFTVKGLDKCTEIVLELVKTYSGFGK